MAPYAYWLLFSCFILAVIESESVHLHPKIYCSWKISPPNIYFKVVGQSTGWIGFAINDKKALMDGSSMFVGGHKDGKGYCYNERGVKHEQPVPGNGNNFKLLKSANNGTHTTLIVQRPLDTGDPKDIRIKPGAKLYLLGALCDKHASSATKFDMHSVHAVKRVTIK